VRRVGQLLHRGPRQGNSRQLRRVELGVDQGGIGRTVAQQVGYFLERTALLNQAACQGMSKRVSTVVRQADATAGPFDHLLDRPGRNRPVSPRHLPDEDRRMTPHRTLMLQIVSERLPGFHRQRQYVLPQRLRALQRRCACAPVDVADHELRDFGRAQSHVQRQTDNRIATRRPAASACNRAQEALNFLWRERTWQRCELPMDGIQDDGAELADLVAARRPVTQITA
jgi:hypothetical protein